MGPALYVEIMIEGVPIRAMADTGAQSAIISCTMLQMIGQQLHRKGKPLPVLEKPPVKFFGKDGVKGGQELMITAQLSVNLALDENSVRAPVFVAAARQYSQPCLLGMNVIPYLGIRVTRANGELLCWVPGSEESSARVSLFKSVTVPSYKGRCVVAKVFDEQKCGDVLFMSLIMTCWVL